MPMGMVMVLIADNTYQMLGSFLDFSACMHQLVKSGNLISFKLLKVTSYSYDPIVQTEMEVSKGSIACPSSYR